jgi:hypothetical protein
VLTNDWNIETVSDVLVLAEQELLRAEKDPKYVINMSMFHTPGISYCGVCLAGCIMTGFIPWDTEWNERLFDAELVNMFKALDYFRQGGIGGFMRCVGISEQDRVKFQQYRENSLDYPTLRAFRGRLYGDDVKLLANQCREWAEWFVEMDMDFKLTHRGKGKRY